MSCTHESFVVRRNIMRLVIMHDHVFFAFGAIERGSALVIKEMPPTPQLGDIRHCDADEPDMTGDHDNLNSSSDNLSRSAALSTSRAANLFFIVLINCPACCPKGLAMVFFDSQIRDL